MTVEEVVSREVAMNMVSLSRGGTHILLSRYLTKAVKVIRSSNKRFDIRPLRST